jgi:glycosyltransferase involved in cell wall biosynthesis
MTTKTLNLFYQEPDPDRWFPLDRYPRRLIRRLVRGKTRPGGQTRVFLNLCAGLDRLSIDYRVNDYRHAQRHPDELACIIGKPHVLDLIPWRNPILFGASIYSHPLSDPQLLRRLPVRRILVPGEWMRKMCEPFWGGKVSVWPVGIDTESWKPAPGIPKNFDFLIYDKVRWDHARYEAELIQPIRDELQNRGLTAAEIRYGFYKEEDFAEILQCCKAMIFLCEHETQGIAYQQALACGVPILAWDRGGFWEDPAFYPHEVQFQPVTSVPYWDQRCGLAFMDFKRFPESLTSFMEKLSLGVFSSRDYILENLTLEKSAEQYLEHVVLCEKSLSK